LEQARLEQEQHLFVVEDPIVRNNKFSIAIVDQGMGISEDGKKNLFMNFAKLHEHSSQNLRGTGLGLSICKKLIGKMGGDVQVDSKLG